MEVLIEEAERRHFHVSQLAQLLLLVFPLHFWQLSSLTRLKVAHDSFCLLFL